MKKKVFAFALTSFFVFGFFLNAQCGKTISESGSFGDNPSYNPNKTAYAYFSNGPTASWLFSFTLGTPNIINLIGMEQPNFFGAGDWANPDGVWGFYVAETNGTPAVFSVNTGTGGVTNLGNITGIISGHTIAIMEWDYTTSKFYIISKNSAQTAEQLYSLNWSTKTATAIGAPGTVCPGVSAGGFSRTGIFYVIETITNSIYRINKVTGIPVLHGASGFSSNQNIDGAFDRSDWRFYVTTSNGTSAGLLEYDTLLSSVPVNLGTFPFNNIISLCVASTPVSSVNQISSVIPNSYSLYQNYPNPFNPATNIKFQIKESGFTTLKVYNAVGIEVAVLVNENLKAGEYETVFNSSGLSSGVYYYKISAGDFSDTKRMILIK